MSDEGSDHIYPNNCSDPLCLEYLTQQDKRNFEMCTSRARVRYSQLLKLNDTDVTLPLGKCHFMNGTNRAAVALVSFTWEWKYVGERITAAGYWSLYWYDVCVFGELNMCMFCVHM